MSIILFRNSRHLRNCLVIGANIRLLGIYSNEFLSNQGIVFPLRTYCEVTRRLLETITPFALEEPKRSYQGSDPIHLYQEQKHGGTIDQPATILVLDLGTTGVNSTKDQITEIATRDLKGGPNSTFHMLVNPEVPLKNHKRNQVLTKSNVPRMKEVIASLVEWVKSRQDSKPVVLVAHNGHCFDFPFLVRAFHQNGYQVPEDWIFFDSLPFARQLRHPDGTKLEKGNHKLNDLVTFCNIVPERSAHKAMVDVNALSSILQQMTFVLKLTIRDLIKRAYKPSRYL